MAGDTRALRLAVPVASEPAAAYEEAVGSDERPVSLRMGPEITARGQ